MQTLPNINTGKYKILQPAYSNLCQVPVPVPPHCEGGWNHGDQDEEPGPGHHQDQHHLLPLEDTCGDDTRCERTALHRRHTELHLTRKNTLSVAMWGSLIIHIRRQNGWATSHMQTHTQGGSHWPVCRNGSPETIGWLATPRSACSRRVGWSPTWAEEWSPPHTYHQGPSCTFSAEHTLGYCRWWAGNIYIY